MTTVANIKKSIMGTIEFDAKFTGSRKEQNYLVYPLNEESNRVVIQSDTRYGYIDTTTGNVSLTASHSNGANSINYQIDSVKNKLKEDVIENWDELKTTIRNTTGKLVGDYIIKTDNSFAINI